MRSPLKSIRYLASDVTHWASQHKLPAVLAVAVLALVAAGLWYLLSREDEDEVAERAPAPEVIVREESEPSAEELETEDLGFPAFATKNTTRVAGPDPISDAAGVALAVHPSTGGVGGPDAVTLVDAGDWPAGIAAASLAADPVGAPILLSDGGELPQVTANALRALAPGGSGATRGVEAFVAGAGAVPEGLESRRIEGDNAAQLAEAVDRVRERLAGEPDHLLVVSSDEPAFAMPAAGWAARSGDPVLFAQRNSLPAPTRRALERHEQTPVYVLGPESAVSARVVREIEEVAPSVTRVAEDEPTANSIAFARFSDGGFGWNINDPGHGFVVASSERPLDAAAAAPLSASGTWGPLLVVEDGAAVPAELRGYLLDLKPGYDEDPTRAVYNHIWLIGDQDALSVPFQAQLDELAEVVPVTSGRGADAIPPLPGAGDSGRRGD